MRHSAANILFIVNQLEFTFLTVSKFYGSLQGLQKRPEDINRRSADMWSFAVLLWELVTREVPFADLSHMEIGMKVSCC